MLSSQHFRNLNLLAKLTGKESPCEVENQWDSEQQPRMDRTPLCETVSHLNGVATNTETLDPSVVSTPSDTAVRGLINDHDYAGNNDTTGLSLSQFKQ